MAVVAGGSVVVRVSLPPHSGEVRRDDEHGNTTKPTERGK